MASKHTTRRIDKTAKTRGPSRDELAIRWFTPRGRLATTELLEDLRHHEGAHVAEIVMDLRRAAVADDAVDLRGIDLRGKDLAGSCLSGADLAGAKLDGANLMRVNLSDARLDFASLSRADLRGAILKGARMSYADLRRADLREADMEHATLDGAVLRGASLRRAWVLGVDFGAAETSDVDLSGVRRSKQGPRNTIRRRAPLGAPPQSEPRPPSTRRMAKLRAAPTLRLKAPDQGPPAESSFEEALAELLLNRSRVGRIAVVIDGVERVLFEGPSALRRVA